MSRTTTTTEPFFESGIEDSSADKQSSVSVATDGNGAADPSLGDDGDGALSIPEIVAIAYLTSGATFTSLGSSGNTQRVKLTFPGCGTGLRARQTAPLEEDGSYGPPWHHALDFLASLAKDHRKDPPRLTDFRVDYCPGQSVESFLCRTTSNYFDYLHQVSEEWLDRKFHERKNKFDFNRKLVTSLEEYVRPFPPIERDSHEPMNNIQDRLLQFDIDGWFSRISEEFAGCTVVEPCVRWDEKEKAIVCTLSRTGNQISE
ncbi:uncharacterized protein L199_002079 [Kwoniella botswanensis]|uniref:uncharacterized protein n=1 Tax=Kwoniella botswanensis TaxID=1268659 RepID=UPI00315DE304